MHLQVATRPNKCRTLVKSLFLASLKCARAYIFQSSFYPNNATVNEGNALIRFFELLHSASSNLQQIRKEKYDTMDASDCWNIDPALLPPSPRAAFSHSFGVHHQTDVWKGLSDVSKEPLRWGWKIENSNYTLIMTDIETEPPLLLRLVRLGGKGPCGAKCGFRKAPAIKPESDQSDYQRSFPDAFKLYYIHDTAVIFLYWSCLRSSNCVGVLEKRCS